MPLSDTRWNCSSAKPRTPVPHHKVFFSQVETTRLIALTSKRTKRRPVSSLSDLLIFELDKHGEFTHLGPKVLDSRVLAVAPVSFQSPRNRIVRLLQPATDLGLRSHRDFEPPTRWAHLDPLASRPLACAWPSCSFSESNLLPHSLRFAMEHLRYPIRSGLNLVSQITLGRGRSSISSPKKPVVKPHCLHNTVRRRHCTGPSIVLKH